MNMKKIVMAICLCLLIGGLSLTTMAEIEKCKICNMEIEGGKAFQDHIRKYHDFPCDRCNYHFTKKEDLEKHKKEKHGAE